MRLSQSKMELKSTAATARKAPSKSTTREATLKSICIPPTTKRVETAATTTHSRLFKVLPSVISYTLVFVAENLKHIATISYSTKYSNPD